MPKFDNWYSTGRRLISSEKRAIRAWSRIQEKPTEIIVNRIDPDTKARSTHQITVRLEFDNESDEYNTAPGGVNILGECIAFGIQDHPTLEDTDLRRDDTFYVLGANFRVINVIPTLGELQFLCEAQR